MPLTPSVTDPNRRKELARKKKDPDSFGTDIKPVREPKEISRSLSDKVPTKGR